MRARETCACTCASESRRIRQKVPFTFRCYTLDVILTGLTDYVPCSECSLCSIPFQEISDRDTEQHTHRQTTGATSESQRTQYTHRERRGGGRPRDETAKRGEGSKRAELVSANAIMSRNNQSLAGHGTKNAKPFRTETSDGSEGAFECERDEKEAQREKEREERERLERDSAGSDR